jgi:hypothetical protein
MVVIAVVRIFTAVEPVHIPPALFSPYIKNIFARGIIPVF